MSVADLIFDLAQTSEGQKWLKHSTGDICVSKCIVKCCIRLHHNSHNLTKLSWIFTHTFNLFFTISCFWPKLLVVTGSNMPLSYV